MTTFNIGIIGAGMIAEHHIKNIQQTQKATVTWLAARNINKVKEVGSKYNIKNCTDNYQEMLKDDKTDAVIICTPPSTHKQIFIDAVSASKHVLLEKPSALTLIELDEMIKVKNKFPHIKVCDASCRHARLQPKYKFVKNFISEGNLGEIYYVSHSSTFMQARAGIEYHPTAKWFLDKKIAGGGPLLDWGVYDLSFHLGILGDKAELKDVNHVFLKNGLDKVEHQADIYDVEEHFVANLQLTNGINFCWERGAHANIEVPNQTRVYGTKGGLVFGYLSWDPTEVVYYFVDNDGKGKANKKVFNVELKNHDDGFALISHFLQVLSGEEEPEMPLELARKHLDIIFKCYQAAEERDKILK